MVIETKYNGYRFRSRLEARWAVVLDHFHIKYEYEKEGFAFKNGKSYLPDFYLPKYDCFFEIKPDDPSYEEKEKMISLFKETGKPVICAWNGFSEDDLKCWIVCFDTNDSGGGLYEDYGYLEIYSKGLHVILPFSGSDRTFFNGNFEQTSFIMNHWPFVSCVPDVIKKGRSARFEFNNKTL